MVDSTGRVVLCTFGTADDAARIARILVEERLAACVNIAKPVRSIYTWQGTVHDEAETLAIIKTTAERFEALRVRLVELHPYDVPEVIALPILESHAPYLAWLVDAVRPTSM